MRLGAAGGGSRRVAVAAVVLGPFVGPFVPVEPLAPFVPLLPFVSGVAGVAAGFAFASGVGGGVGSLSCGFGSVLSTCVVVLLGVCLGTNGFLCGRDRGRTACALSGRRKMGFPPVESGWAVGGQTPERKLPKERMFADE